MQDSEILRRIEREKEKFEKLETWKKEIILRNIRRKESYSSEFSSVIRNKNTAMAT